MYNYRAQKLNRYVPSVVGWRKVNWTCFLDFIRLAMLAEKTFLCALNHIAIFLVHGTPERRTSWQRLWFPKHDHPTRSKYLVLQLQLHLERQDRPCAILQTLTATSSKLRKSAQKSASCMEFVGCGLSRIHLSYHIASWLSFNGLSVELEIIFPAWSGTKYANICILTLTVRLRSFTPLVAINWDGGPNPQKILPTFVFTSDSSDSSGMRNPKSLGGFRPTLAIDLEALGYIYCTYMGPVAHLVSEKMVLSALAQCLAKWHSWKPHIVRFFKLSSTFCTAGAKASKAKPLR